MEAGGIGDALAGLLVTSCAKKQFPDDPITYSCNHHAWVQLFDGYDNLISLTPHGININAGYDLEIQAKSAEPRWVRYCRNAGVTEPIVPQLKEKEKLLEAGNGYKGRIALCPFSVYSSRNYSLMGWLTLEKMLIAKGYDCLIVHNKQPDMKDFKSEKTNNKTPSAITSMLLNASVVVAVDSGLAHLSSMVGTKTIVLSGPTRASKVFYCPVTEIVSSLDCVGCYWQKPHYLAQCSDKACAALWNISPGAIVEAVERLTSNHLPSTA